MNESLYPFVNHTTYDLKALGAMNRLAERGVRREKSRRTKGICGVLGLIGLVGGVYCYPPPKPGGQPDDAVRLDPADSAHLLEELPAALLPAAAQGMKECTYEFDEEEIICTTAAGERRYSYEQVFAVVSDMAWYVIFFDASHGIILDKNGFSVGTPGTLRPSSGRHPAAHPGVLSDPERMAPPSPGHFAAEKFVCPAPVRANTEETWFWPLLRPDVCNAARKEKTYEKKIVEGL